MSDSQSQPADPADKATEDGGKQSVTYHGRLRSWFSRRWSESSAFRVTARLVLPGLWWLFAAAWGTAEIECAKLWGDDATLLNQAAAVGLPLTFVLAFALSILMWVAIDDADEEKKRLRQDAAAARIAVEEAENAVRLRESLLLVIGEVVELKADHLLEQLRLRRENADATVRSYDAWGQLDKLLVAVVSFFSRVLEQAQGPDVEVYGVYFVKKGDFLVETFSHAFPDHTWSALGVSKRFSDAFNLSLPTPQSAAAAAVRSPVDLHLIGNCPEAARDSSSRFRYFEAEKEEARNKSMMMYVVRDEKDERRTRGIYCVYTNVEGVFDENDERMSALCERVMLQIGQRAILEHRKIDLTNGQNES